jgi:hypothetical protein
MHVVGSKGPFDVFAPHCLFHQDSALQLSLQSGVFVLVCLEIFQRH